MEEELIKEILNANQKCEEPFPIFCCAKWTDKNNGKGFWFRIFGYGVHFTNGPLTFSQRNGYERYINLPFGYKLKKINRKYI